MFVLCFTLIRHKLQCVWFVRNSKTISRHQKLDNIKRNCAFLYLNCFFSREIFSFGNSLQRLKLHTLQVRMYYRWCSLLTDICTGSRNFPSLVDKIVLLLQTVKNLYNRQQTVRFMRINADSVLLYCLHTYIWYFEDHNYIAL